MDGVKRGVDNRGMITPGCWGGREKKDFSSNEERADVGGERGRCFNG